MDLTSPVDVRPQHSVSVAGVIRDDAGRVLLIQRADTQEWEIPGGIVEVDEEILHALVREVREETGVVVSPGRLTGVYKNMSAAVVALVFECQPLTRALRTSSESLQVSYMECSELPKYVGDRIRVRIDDALGFSGSAVIRAHSFLWSQPWKT